MMPLVGPANGCDSNVLHAMWDTDGVKHAGFGGNITNITSEKFQDS